MVPETRPLIVFITSLITVRTQIFGAGLCSLVWNTPSNKLHFTSYEKGNPIGV